MSEWLLVILTMSLIGWINHQLLAFWFNSSCLMFA